MCNAKFEEKGLAERIDHRSYERQGVDLLPTIHEGPAIRQMEAKGIRTDKGEFNRWIKATNSLIQSVRKKIAALLDWLTELIPEILTMVDNGKIALSPAVEISYLTKQEQRDLLETMESEDCTPSLSQAIQMKKLSQVGLLDMDRIFNILREPKANQQDKISFWVGDLRKYFPKSYSAVRIQAHITKLLEADLRKRQRDQSRRAVKHPKLGTIGCKGGHCQ